MKKLSPVFFVLLLVLLNQTANTQSKASAVSNPAFRLQYGEKGIGGLWKT